jgi:hypothetical protein
VTPTSDHQSAPARLPPREIPTGEEPSGEPATVRPSQAGSPPQQITRDGRPHLQRTPASPTDPAQREAEHSPETTASPAPSRALRPTPLSAQPTRPRLAVAAHLARHSFHVKPHRRNSPTRGRAPTSIRRSRASRRDRPGSGLPPRLPGRCLRSCSRSAEHPARTDPPPRGAERTAGSTTSPRSRANRRSRPASRESRAPARTDPATHEAERPAGADPPRRKAEHPSAPNCLSAAGPRTVDPRRCSRH